jgi:hypothetical protein
MTLHIKKMALHINALSWYKTAKPYCRTFVVKFTGAGGTVNQVPPPHRLFWVIGSDLAVLNRQHWSMRPDGLNPDRVDLFSQVKSSRRMVSH